MQSLIDIEAAAWAGCTRGPHPRRYCPPSGGRNSQHQHRPDRRTCRTRHAESWRESLDNVIATGVPHASVYMLEVDEDSRLGRELIAGGTRYHAHFVPDDDAPPIFTSRPVSVERGWHPPVRDFQFARPGFESRHNLKYWTRQPYLGFGVDAHSMLLSAPAKRSPLRDARCAGKVCQRFSPSENAGINRRRSRRNILFGIAPEPWSGPGPHCRTIRPARASSTAAHNRGSRKTKIAGAIRKFHSPDEPRPPAIQRSLPHFLIPDPRSQAPALVTPSV